ncbi:MAG TPA: hypothetical protein VF677_12160 [Flavobacterium sp.]|jgi:hypothetical protein
MNTIYLLSKSFIAENKIAESIKKTAKSLNLQFVKNDRVYNVSVPDFGDLLEIYPSDHDDLQSDKEKELFKKDYGALLIIDYNNGGEEEDKVLIPFLVEFLKEYPEMLVYEDETNNKPFIYSKADFDAVNDISISTAFFKIPPRDPGSMS